MIMDEDSWYVVRHTAGVTKFVGSAKKPIPAKESEIKKIIHRSSSQTEKIELDVKAGDKVRITSGPFADFVADIRAATPTAAAEIAVPNLVDLLNTINQYKIRLNNNITGNISYLKDILKKLSTSYVLSNPLATFEIREQKLDELVNRLNTNLIHKLDVSKNRFDSIKTKRVLLHPEDILVKYNNSMELVINKLELLNPLNVLKKGYSVTKVNDKPLKSIKDVKEKDKLNIKIIDGEIDAIVEGVK